VVVAYGAYLWSSSSSSSPQVAVYGSSFDGRCGVFYTREVHVSNEDSSRAIARPRKRVQRYPLSGQVVDEITAMILSGELAPGTPLIQDDLAEQLSISRTPLREALHKLFANGLVTQDRTGTFAVVNLTFKDARDVFEMREAIEVFAARMAALRATDEQITELGRVIVQLKEASDPFDSARYLDAVTAYQSALLRASGNQSILTFENAILMNTRFLYPRWVHREDRLRAATKENARLFEAIRKRQPEEAARLAAEHLKRVMEFWMEESEAGTLA
jgi:DNA-binding GntR family transcriptional regulator